MENKYLAQVFQALRIEVNDEMEALKEFLQAALEVLEPGVPDWLLLPTTAWKTACVKIL
jgi:hypothetical protein